MRKRTAPSKRIRKITPKGNEKPRVTKDLKLEYRPATSIRTLAERMKTKTLARYLLKLAKTQGLEIEDVNQSLEVDVAEKILAAFK